MKKIVLTIVAGLAMVLLVGTLLTGCGGKEEAKPEGEHAAPAAPAQEQKAEEAAPAAPAEAAPAAEAPAAAHAE